MRSALRFGKADETDVIEEYLDNKRDRRLREEFDRYVPPRELPAACDVAGLRR